MMDIKRHTMLAMAAGALISPAIMAADLDTPTENDFWSTELLNLAQSDSVIAAGAIGVTLGAEYAVQDKITLTFSGGAMDNTTLTASVVVPCVDESAAGAGDGLAAMTWGLLNSDANQATWRVTEIDPAACVGATSTTGHTIAFAPANTLEFSAPLVNANKGVSITFSAETSSGDALDTGGAALRTANLITVANEIDYSVDGFSAVVDVNTDRTTLIPGPDDQASYSLDLLTFPDDCCDDVNLVFKLGSEVTWEGDFSWITDDDEVTPGIQPQGGVVAMPGCDPTNIVVTATSISNDDCSFGGSDLVLDPSSNTDGAGDLVTLAATAYSANIVANYDDDGEWLPCCGNIGSSEFTGVAAGAWTLNGFQSKVAYMPFQTGIGQVIYIANRGKQSGEITVDWIDQTGGAGTFSIGQIEAGSTRAIGPAINAGLPEAQREGGRLALTITANIPACDAQLNAQYNVSGDRAFSVATNNCTP